MTTVYVRYIQLFKALAPPLDHGGTTWRSSSRTHRTSPSTSRSQRRYATPSPQGSAAGEQLPSIRALAAQLRISAITTKRAYQDLEAQGYVTTIPGKGCFVAEQNLDLLREERLRRVEASLARAVCDARACGLSDDELREMLDIQLEEK